MAVSLTSMLESVISPCRSIWCKMNGTAEIVAANSLELRTLWNMANSLNSVTYGSLILRKK